MDYLSEEDEQYVAEDFSGPPGCSRVTCDASLLECYEYIKSVKETNRVKTVPDLLTNVAYVYLGRMERVALAWRILKTLFR